jgi:hypothetical protein
MFCSAAVHFPLLGWTGLSNRMAHVDNKLQRFSGEVYDPDPQSVPTNSTAKETLPRNRD